MIPPVALVLTLSLGIACEEGTIDSEAVEAAVQEALNDGAREETQQPVQDDVSGESSDSVVEQAMTFPSPDIKWESDMPLHRAAFDGSVAEVQELLDSGADVDAQAEISPVGTIVTPLHLAVWNPDPSVAALLLARWVSPASPANRRACSS